MVVPCISTCTMVIPWCVWGTREHHVNQLEHDSGDNTVPWYYHSTFVSVFTEQMNADTRAGLVSRAHSRALSHAHKHTHRRTERGNNANNVSVCVCVSAALLCVRHYPIILSGAAAAQAGILTTASGPSCTATRVHAPDAAPRSSGRRRSNRNFAWKSVCFHKLFIYIPKHRIYCKETQKCIRLKR